MNIFLRFGGTCLFREFKKKKKETSFVGNVFIMARYFNLEKKKIKKPYYISNLIFRLL